ncbi:MAG: hypothetical protein QM778_28230 [Myxococcales bacterium]
MQVVDAALAELGIDPHARTQPQMVAAVLRDDMHLATCPAVTRLLEEALREPQSLAPILASVRHALAGMPPIVEFLALVVPRGMLRVAREKHALERCITHLFVLDRLVARASEEQDFLDAVRKHLEDQQASGGVRRGREFSDVSRLAGPFVAVKKATMDFGLRKLREARLSGHISPRAAQQRKLVLWLNIMEAVVTDLLHGQADNALAGLALASVSARSVSIDATMAEVEYEFSPAWVALYTSWNLAFITANTRFLPLLYPKLLAPAVISVAPERYVFRRAIALSLSIDFLLLALINQRHEVTISHRQELARLWGPINRRHGGSLLVTELAGRFHATFQSKLAPFLSRNSRAKSLTPASPTRS